MMNVLISVVVLAQRGVPTCNRNFSALGFVIVWKMHCARRQSATAAEIWRVPLSGNFGIEDILYDGYRINCCCCAEAAPHFTVPSLLLCARCFSFVSADSATKKKKVADLEDRFPTDQFSLCRRRKLPTLPSSYLFWNVGRQVFRKVSCDTTLSSFFIFSRLDVKISCEQLKLLSPFSAVIVAAQAGPGHHQDGEASG